MSKIDDQKSRFENKLEARREQHASQVEAECQLLRSQVLSQCRRSLPTAAAKRQVGVQSLSTRPMPQSHVSGYNRPTSILNAAPGFELVNLTSGPLLKELDGFFIERFDLARYYPVGALDYPTVFCETLEEFFAPFLAQADLSPQARQKELERLVSEAQAMAARGAGVYGVDLTGLGCYINGWIFSYVSGIPPQEILNHPRTRNQVLETIAHEKLGHGFLVTYSALGKVATALGLAQIEVANKFGLRLADDPISRLRQQQAQLLLRFSFLLEEGWGTWIESYFAANVLGSGTHPKHDLQTILKAVENLPAALPEREEICQALLMALNILFFQEEPEMDALLQAVLTIDFVGFEVDPHLRLRQPLRYAVGELLLEKAARNLGPLCVPYAALIAGNVSFNPEQISLGDLRDLMSKDLRLNPDARLAAICSLRLQRRDQVSDLVEKAQAELSFTVPQELKTVLSAI
jgi:hypothetical protein